MKRQEDKKKNKGGRGACSLKKNKVSKFKYSLNMVGKYYGGHMFQIFQ